MRVPTFNGAHDGFHDYLADMDYYFDCYMFDKHKVQFVRMRLVGPTRISWTKWKESVLEIYGLYRDIGRYKG